VPWITPTDLTANASKYILRGAENISNRALQNSNATLVPKGSIVFSTRGTVGNTAIAASPLTCNQSCEILVPKNGEIDGEFLYYLLKFGASAFIRLSGGTTFSSITRRDIARVRFAVPSHPREQAAIGRLLDAVDAAMERARTAIHEATNLKNALLQQFFYVALGETAYADRPKKKLPEGWALVPTETLLAREPKNGASPKAFSQPPGTPTFSIAAVREGRVNLQGQENIKYGQLPDKVAEQFRVRRGDVLIVRGNANPDLVGKAGIIDQFPEGCIYPDITKRVVFRTEGEQTVTAEFAVLAWNHAIIHNQVLRRAKTSNGTLKINSRDVRQIIMPVPRPDEQSTIVKLAAAVDQKVEALANVLVAQEQLKKSLMHDLLTGRVRIPIALAPRSTIDYQLSTNPP
jgi:type I restriction enzyme S subunit